MNQASNKEIKIWEKILSLFTSKKKPLKTVYKSGKKATSRTKTNNLTQQQIDSILDKISKSGYDSLTKAEKDFLFKQGKK